MPADGGIKIEIRSKRGQPAGNFVLRPATGTIDIPPSLLSNPNIAGFVLRDDWNSGNPAPASPSDIQNVGRTPSHPTARPASGVVRTAGSKTKYTNPSSIGLVMNGGRIEQAGSPRDVFNAPRTAFVAQFMGGHNVIATDRGQIAVRADRLKLYRSGEPRARLSGVVRSIEYQGTHVQVTLDAQGAGELTATLNEAEFDAFAVHPEQQVAIDWSDHDIHRLSNAA